MAAPTKAIRLHVEIGPERTVVLPSDVPLGPAEVTVVVAGPAESSDVPSPVGLFSDAPEIVDEAMGYVRELRAGWQMRAPE